MHIKVHAVQRQNQATYLSYRMNFVFSFPLAENANRKDIIQFLTQDFTWMINKNVMTLNILFNILAYNKCNPFLHTSTIQYSSMSYKKPNFIIPLAIIKIM